MQALVLQHLAREGPELVAELCGTRGLGVEVRRLDDGAEVPDRVAPGDILVVMGGPMGVRDLDDPRHPFLRREVALLRAALAGEQPVLGICLGAQLLAHAAGAAIYPVRRPDVLGAPRPSPEVGFGEVALVDQGAQAVLAGLPSPLPVLHWHGDTFDLPDGAVRLAENEVCPNQAFRIGARAFGLQFHVEIGAEQVRDWVREDEGFVKAALGADGPERVLRALPTAIADVRASGRRLLDNLLAAMLS